jgi:hypothetical protein
MEDNTSRKDITLRLNMNILSAISYLRGHISRSAAPKKDILDITVGGKSEIIDDRFHRMFVPHQNILRFQIPMHNPLLMQEFQSF